ncbi:MAG TPA: MerC domain-containing protein [Drouetiella sp.]
MEKVTSEDVIHVDSQAIKLEGSCCDTHDQNEVIADSHRASEPVDACCSGHEHSVASVAHEKEHSSRHAIVSMDTLGILASTLCLIHCLAMPLVVAFLPVLGLQFLEGHAAHQILAGFVVCFGLCAILPGYLKHRKPLVLAGLVAGLVLVLTATFGYVFGLSESIELPLITVGNLVLVMSHFFNRKLCRCDHH